MKNLFKFIYPLGLCLILALSFSSCSDDDDKSSEALILEITFDNPIVTQQPVIDGTNIYFYIKEDAQATDLEKLIPTFTISPKATSDPKSGSEIDFSKGSAVISVTAEDGVTKNIYNVRYISGASIVKMTFNSPVVTQQPIINGKTILFHIADNATLSDLQELIPNIELPEGATVKPASGSKVDFSKGTVNFVVTSEDGKSKTTYKASLWRNKHNFEEWYEQGTASHTANNIKMKYYAPTGFWSSSNVGASFLIMFGQSKEVVVTKTDDAHSGTGAARIETIQSNKLDGTGGALYPVVTTGSLFLGEFKTDILNTLNSTKFGIPYNKKPLAVKGYYKYTPGAEFLRCPEPKNYNKVNVETGTKDECAINAILYEINSEDDPYITGVDTYNEEKLTAIAKLQDGTAKANYTAFSINMKYLKTYDPTKKYRFAIICSSSKSGDTFSGAPGSVLYVDDIEVVSE